MKKFKLREKDFFKTEGLSQCEYVFLVNKFIEAGARNHHKHGADHKSWRDLSYVVYFSNLCTSAQKGAREIKLTDFPEYKSRFLKNNTKTKFPYYDFKVDCGDSPALRQWLKDNGCVWHSGNQVTTHRLLDKYLSIRKSVVTRCCTKEFFDLEELPYVDVEFCVTGYTSTLSEYDTLKCDLKRLKVKQRKIKDEIKAIQNKLENK